MICVQLLPPSVLYHQVPLVVSRLVMAMPNLVPVLLPFFEGAGHDGMAAYLRELERRGVVVLTDHGPELVA